MRSKSVPVNIFIRKINTFLDDLNISNVSFSTTDTDTLTNLSVLSEDNNYILIENHQPNTLGNEDVHSSLKLSLMNQSPATSSILMPPPTLNKFGNIQAEIEQEFSLMFPNKPTLSERFIQYCDKIIDIYKQSTSNTKEDVENSSKGEGGEEGSPDEGEKLEGDDDLESMSATSAVSQGRHDDDDVCSPPPVELLSPASPRSFHGDNDVHRSLRSRCDSRDSASSSAAPPSPSAESTMSERAALLRAIPLGTSLSPVGVALPPTLPAAAFLPPQSAAMAAYLNAAAAVAHHSHRLLMTSPPTTRGHAPTSPPTTRGHAPTSPPTVRGHAHSPGEEEEEAVLDFSRRDDDADAALDLSVGGGRKRRSEEPPSLQPPSQRRPQWGASHLPYFAAAVAAASGLAPSGDASRALEKMSELSKLGGDELLFRGGQQASTANAGGRHSAWQSHWLNKGAEQARDVLRCVWCKQSFPTLAALTVHMKEAKHCGVNVPNPQPPPTAQPQQITSSPTSNNSSSSSTSVINNSGGGNKNELNMLIKETMPLPRKLVRGQDVWLGKGAEQTRQILKCMWCGQSFRSLAEMTSHMQQTQHYTNIISQEQIISWRSTDDPKGGGGHSGAGPPPPPGAASSHVSAVLTCKVCDQAFSSLKELSNHMVKNSHYKEHIMRSITESGGRRRQTREKRKKSLPVRKLLELERAQHDFKNGDDNNKMRDAGRITCEKCANKIDTSHFVDHIRQCVGGVTGGHHRNLLKSALTTSVGNNAPPPPGDSPNRDKPKTPPSDKSPSSEAGNKEQAPSNGSSPSVLNAIEKLIEKSFDSRSRQNANFPAAHTPPMGGSSILKRLGIDESVDYTKPLVDAQTMNLLRSYHHHQQQQQQYARRERSGSESSSMSERGSSRVESLTPERKMEPPSTTTPRSTPDIKRERTPDVEPPKVKEEPTEQQEEHGEGEGVASGGGDEEEEGEQEEGSPGGSLGALSSMFDSLSGEAGQSGGGKRGSGHHPLAALQKLCDKTETTPPPRSVPTASVSVATSTPTSTPGAILAFSWACNDAVVTSDSVMKCAFCDTPFISKGAYRHHLSKMHFVKDGVMPEAVAVKAPPTHQPLAAAASGVPLKGTPPSGNAASGGGKSPPTAAGGFEESPHSKFLKYTELAKQLSSKYV